MSGTWHACDGGVLFGTVVPKLDAIAVAIIAPAVGSVIISITEEYLCIKQFG